MTNALTTRWTWVALGLAIGNTAMADGLCPASGAFLGNLSDATCLVTTGKTGATSLSQEQDQDTQITPGVMRVFHGGDTLDIYTFEESRGSTEYTLVVQGIETNAIDGMDALAWTKDGWILSVGLPHEARGNGEVLVFELDDVALFGDDYANLFTGHEGESAGDVQISTPTDFLISIGPISRAGTGAAWKISHDDILTGTYPDSGVYLPDFDWEAALAGEEPSPSESTAHP